jgi:hypothetical protein
MNDEFKQDWGGQATKALVGKKIVAARYLNDDEVESLGWFKSAIVLLLDDGT